ncbi:hypothetical protein GCM10027048_10980 [Hymenobacter coalescens]
MILTEVYYHDMHPLDILTSNGATDIIAQQVELVFEGRVTVYISWDTVPGWMQYSLSVSCESFCTEVERFAPDSVYWQRCLGQPLEAFEVFGLSKETWTEYGTHGTKQETFYNEPHLVVLNFGGHRIGVANWCAENNFVPHLPYGDDVWILFDEREIETHIKALGFD